MKRNKLRYLVILVLLSLVVTACGGDSDTASDSPEATEAPIETLAAPATTSPPPVKLVVWAEEKVATALDPLVGAYEAAAGVDAGSSDDAAVDDTTEVEIDDTTDVEVEV